MHKIIMLLSLAILAGLPLMADKENGSVMPTQTDSPIPYVPEFSITYQGEALVCSPIELIKTKTRKELVKYKCQGKYSDNESEKNKEEARGHAETERLEKEVKNKIAQGTVYTVEIPMYAAQRPQRARRLAEQQLNNKPYGKYLRMLLPAKLYISIRPQLANSNDGNGVT